MPPPRHVRWRTRSGARLSTGKARRLASAPRSGSRCSGRPTSLPTFWRRRIGPCTPARRRARTTACRVNPTNSRNDVRRELILDEGNPILQHELALLQALHLKDVGTGRNLKRLNGGIEVAMFLQQARKLQAKLAFFLFG